jgi:acyl-CoA thioesterase
MASSLLTVSIVEPHECTYAATHFLSNSITHTITYQSSIAVTNAVTYTITVSQSY